MHQRRSRMLQRRWRGTRVLSGLMGDRRRPCRVAAGTGWLPGASSRASTGAYHCTTPAGVWAFVSALISAQVSRHDEDLSAAWVHTAPWPRRWKTLADAYPSAWPSMASRAGAPAVTPSRVGQADQGQKQQLRGHQRRCQLHHQHLRWRIHHQRSHQTAESACRSHLRCRSRHRTQSVRCQSCPRRSQF